MKTKIKKVMSLSALVFVFGFIGTFLEKNLDKAASVQKLEKNLGLKTSDAKKIEVAQGSQCVEQKDDDKSGLFVGCNGFF